MTINTALLLHCDGANGDTSFTDSGDFGVTVVNVGGVVKNTAEKRFGESGADFNGTNYLRVDDPSANNLSQTAFCIEFWFKSTQSPLANSTWIAKRNGGGFVAGAWAIQFMNNSGAATPIVYAADFSTSSEMLISTIGGLNDGVRRHGAFTYDGTTYRLFFGGALAASRVTTAKITAATDQMSIGYDMNYGRNYVGNLDELRITNGDAVYTAAFTPPAYPFKTTVAAGAIIEPTDTVTGSMSHSVQTSFSGAIVEPADTVAGSMAVGTYTVSGSGVLPSLTALGSMVPLTDGGAVLLPALTARGFGGGEGSVRLMPLSASGSAQVAYQAGGAVRMPLLKAVGSIGNSVTASGSATLPRLTAKGYGGGSGAVFLKSLFASGAGSVGTIGGGNVTLLALRAAGVMDRPEYILKGAITLPMLMVGPQGRGAVVLPTLFAAGSAKQIVAIQYEAYCVNLKHTSDHDPNKESAVNQVTRYEQYEGKQIIRVGKKYLIVSEGTIDEIGGATDNGNAIPWSFKTGFSDMGSRNLKTVRQMYIGGRITAGFTATVMASERPEESYDFSTPRSNLPRNNRVTTGRGIISRYYGFGLSNDQGERVDIESVQVELDVSARSI